MEYVSLEIDRLHFLFSKKTIKNPSKTCKLKKIFTTRKLSPKSLYAHLFTIKRSSQFKHILFELSNSGQFYEVQILFKQSNLKHSNFKQSIQLFFKSCVQISSYFSVLFLFCIQKKCILWTTFEQVQNTKIVDKAKIREIPRFANWFFFKSCLFVPLVIFLFSLYRPLKLRPRKLYLKNGLLAPSGKLYDISVRNFQLPKPNNSNNPKSQSRRYLGTEPADSKSAQRLPRTNSTRKHCFRCQRPI